MLPLRPPASRYLRSATNLAVTQRSTPACPARRAFHVSPRSQVEARDVSASQGSDSAALAQDITPLLQPHGRWSLVSSGSALERTFHFGSFRNTWAFMSEVAEECKKQRHHPEWTNVFTKVHVRWTTHVPQGLSGKDAKMAEFCDGAARRWAETVKGEEEGCGCEAAKGG